MLKSKRTPRVVMRITMLFGLIVLPSIVAWAKMALCTSQGRSVGNGESSFATVSWAAEGSCCGSGSGSALVEYTYCYGARCSTTSYYITTQQAQFAAGCNPV